MNVGNFLFENSFLIVKVLVYDTYMFQLLFILNGMEIAMNKKKIINVFFRRYCKYSLKWGVQNYWNSNYERHDYKSATFQRIEFVMLLEWNIIEYGYLPWAINRHFIRNYKKFLLMIMPLIYKTRMINVHFYCNFSIF